MKYPEVTCKFCPIVNKLAYWGPRPVEKWKRTACLILSALLFILPVLLLTQINWVSISANQTPLFLMSGFLLFISLLGIIVALKGCDHCVARLMGDCSP